jgi:hypothetical protein
MFAAAPKSLSTVEDSRPSLGWLPPGKAAAVCFSIDDIHPSTSHDAYEAGGDLAAGALGGLAELQRRHPELDVTLCVTPNWRLDQLVPSPLLRFLPWINRRLHWTRLAPPDQFRLDRHPHLVRYLNSLERSEVVLHGLHHAHVGPHFATEFQGETEDECLAVIERGLKIFQDAGLRFRRGFVPPAWNAPSALLAALDRLKFEFVSSARDLRTSVARDARTAMSGLTGLSLIYPQLIQGTQLVHITCNFQATSSLERAFQIMDCGGLLHIKAHIFKEGGGHRMLDGLDDRYVNYLDAVFSGLNARFGTSIWWAKLSEVAARWRGWVTGN